jgi:hypothetical protein
MCLLKNAFSLLVMLLCLFKRLQPIQIVQKKREKNKNYRQSGFFLSLYNGSATLNKYVRMLDLQIFGQAIKAASVSR